MTETQRIILLPLNYQQLTKYMLCDGSLETELGICRSQDPIPPELNEALQESILQSVATTGPKYKFYTLWTIIDRQMNRMVGDLCLMGEPDSHGEITLGYGTYSGQQGKGYMTEAVGIFIRWAFEQEGVKTILAETMDTNIASWRVLEKNGFYKEDDEGSIWLWRLDKKE